VTDLVFDDPCILFALRRESRAFRRVFKPQERFPDAPCWARFCGEPWLSVLVLETGVGAEPTRRALEWALSQPVLGNIPYKPKIVLCAGFCGALEEDRHVADIILANEVVDAEGHVWPTTWPGDLPPGEWRPPLHRGRVLSLPRLVGDPAEKRALGRKHLAVAADMESEAAAEVCRRRGVPFGCVRVISDDLHTSLSPQLVKMLSGGRVSPLGLVLGTLRSPGLAREMWRLAKDTYMAAERLGTALGELLTLTLSWPVD
jgi:hypothetical protein